MYFNNDDNDNKEIDNQGSVNPYKLGFLTMAMAVILTFLLLHQFVVSESNIEVREAAKKKNVFFGISFPNLFTPPPQGFCEIWENKR